ncbi:MAG: hypothetical protein ABSH20_15785 [Tepidisphaeraceae bacterium]|jgi:hypothetical protein
MNEDQLRHLLVQADTPMPGLGAPPAAIAAVVRRRLARRRRFRAAGSIVVLALIVVGLRVTIPRPIPPVPGMTPRHIALLLERVRQLRDEGDARLATVDRATHRRVVTTTARDPLLELRFDFERSAMIVLETARAVEHQAGDRQQAIARYQRVIELFPDSCGAELAKQRIRELSQG